MSKYSCGQSAINRCSDIDENDSEGNLDEHDAETEKENTKSTASTKRKKGLNWLENETFYFIQLCTDKKIFKLTDGENCKHIDVYKSLEPDMREASFAKSATQMKVKMKHLKEMYYKCKRSNSISERMSFPYFHAMGKLLGGNTKTVISTRRRKGINWMARETSYFIQLCIDKQIVKLMDEKRYKHIDIYKSLEQAMKEAGFNKSAAQMKLKIKHLKEMYYKCKRNLINERDRMAFQYFDAMDKLFDCRTSAKATEGVGIESSTSESMKSQEISQRTDDEAELMAKNVFLEVDPQPVVSDNIMKTEEGTDDEAKLIAKNVHIEVDLQPVVSNKILKTEDRISKKAEQFTEMFVKRQVEMFQGICNTQNELLVKSMQEQIEEYRKWETETMKKEYDYQTQQMNMLMDRFLKGLQTIQQNQNVPSSQPTVHPFPESSTYSSQTSSPISIHNSSLLSVPHDVETEEENTKSVVSIRRKKGLNWRSRETNCFIQLCIDKQIVKLMDGKKYKHIDIYESLEPAMREAGFSKNAAQMKVKMKHLKETYYKCKKSNSINERTSFQYFEAMDKLLSVQQSVKTTDDVSIESNTSESQELDNQEIIQGTDDEAELITKNVLIEVDSQPVVSDKKRQKIEGRIYDEAKLIAKNNVEVDLQPVVSDKKRQKIEGRLSNVKRAEQFTETFVKKQVEMFQGICNTQNELLVKSMQAQVEEQRKWETEMMKKEHDHQTRQMNMLMDGFLKGLQTIQQNDYAPSFQSTVHPFPESSTCSSQTSSSTFVHKPSSLSVSALSCSSSSLMSPLTKSLILPSSSSPSVTSNCAAPWSSSPPPSSLQIPLSPPPNNQFSSSPIPQKFHMYFVPGRPPSSVTDKQTEFTQ